MTDKELETLDPVESREETKPISEEDRKFMEDFYAKDRAEKKRKEEERVKLIEIVDERLAVYFPNLKPKILYQQQKVDIKK